MYSSEFYIPKDYILDYLLYTRQAGHTTLSIEGAKNYNKPFYIVGIDQRHAVNLSQEIQNKNGIPTSLQSFTHKVYVGNNIPAFIDNGTLITLLIEYRDSIYKYKEMLQKIDSDIVEYDEYNKHNHSLMSINANRQLSHIKKLSLWDRLFKYKKIVGDFRINLTTPKSYKESINDIRNERLFQKTGMRTKNK